MAYVKTKTKKHKTKQKTKTNKQTKKKTVVTFQWTIGVMNIHPKYVYVIPSKMHKTIMIHLTTHIPLYYSYIIM